MTRDCFFLRFFEVRILQRTDYAAIKDDYQTINLLKAIKDGIFKFSSEK
jgi:hypothetical protein